jgi:hypothetical protein
MKYTWIDGKVKFYKYEKDGQYYFEEIEGGTPIEQPTAELLERLQGKTFKNYTEAKGYIENGCPLTETEMLALALAELYEVVAGGIE